MARFQIIKNTLELLYSQALLWFGAFFCPLLPSLAVFKVVLLYYVKKHNTLSFCEPPLRAFKATHNFKLLLNSIALISLVLVLLPMGYAIVKCVVLVSHCIGC